MIYLKSIVAGLAAVFSFAVLFLLGVVIYLVVSAPKERGEGAIGWDPIALIRPGPMLIILAVFVAGFLWEFRHASK
ncbi:MAG TPA: hypothetical protein VN946_01595 [Terriglobales bacterium]|jgi:uncharacterized BrkB/YihY/UPF0761 family membrane protein|nr:hypothetical protein [Terriglobales bacterium]